MPRPITSRRHYRAELSSMLTLRKVVEVDTLHDPQWRAAACSAVDTLIELFGRPTQPPALVPSAEATGGPRQG